MSDQSVDSRANALLQALLRSGGAVGAGGAAGLAAAGSTTTGPAAGPLDQYQGQLQLPGFPGQLTQTRTGSASGNTRESNVQPGNGDMTEMLTQEFGPQAVALLNLLSGTSAGMFGGLGTGAAGGGGSMIEMLEEIISEIGGNGSTGTGGFGLSSNAQGINNVSNPSAEPLLMAGSTGTQEQGHYVSFSNATLWGDGTIQSASGNSQQPLSAQVQQGGAGDCYFLSSLASLATSNPQSVKDMVRPDPDGVAGHYQVRFYSKDAQSGQMKPEWVSVDDKLPVGADGKTLYDHVPLDGQGHPCVGMALIEKAYAKFNDEHQDLQNEGVEAGSGYDGIGQGGTGAEALEALTGQPAQISGGGGESSYGSSVSSASGGGTTGSLAGSMSQEQILALLQPANNHQPITAGTVGTGGVPDANGIPRLAGGLIPGHQYSVLGTYTDKSGQTMVSLRNPWGGDANGQPGADSQGVFSISLDQFTKDFGTIVGAAGGQGTGSTSSGTQQFTGNNAQTFSLRNLQSRV